MLYVLVRTQSEADGLWSDQEATATGSAAEEVVYGGQRIVRHGIGQVLGVR